ncbi:hypothetical protein [Cohnella nanjingensis]|uniref:Preprotein translocase subunit Tim44 n=1 Tax=Cohnella nanjingensis TaxID=1387779 RepID=A0A7X0RMV2_9BACL|nr:hypothetical protein [Cohnella nanjingensis]MBB6669135.1 hypothetical protein [Cohnella nanjingensis]
MLKKLLLVFSLFAFTVTIAMPADVSDAARKSFSSGKKSFTKTPSKAQDNVSKSTTGTNKSTNGATTTPNRGFMSGGSFMKGMMIGGLAGMLFGGMFGGMGFFGDILGLLVNLAAIFLLVTVIMAIVNSFKRRRQHQPQGPNDNQRRW